MNRVFRAATLMAMLLGAGLSSCNKIDFGPDEGYTEKDSSNQSTGAVDNSDWTSDKDWKKEEKELFKDSGVDLSQGQQGGVGTLSFYPNACASVGAFTIQSVSVPLPPVLPLPPVYSLHGRLAVVDKKYQVLSSSNFELQTDRPLMLRLDFSDGKFKSGTLYRMYYILYDDSKTLFLKGHGDIKIKK
ncbi:hypothetical protein [Hymenobacter sp. CRA2]|uniref:hypothetical protein n=1 Tax=Hymenobacter sp. CRA2 TaxID=1955620 RepID=UPI0009903189|nr:hypothetical protein [Hymenobacter sp. CRA2]OON68021.1 hypothetical protein B0919_15275 [Hymenobacter sp. CRA2]